MWLADVILTIVEVAFSEIGGYVGAYFIRLVTFGKCRPEPSGNGVESFLVQLLGVILMIGLAVMIYKMSGV